MGHKWNVFINNSHKMEKLPFECKIKILEHLSSKEIITLQNIYPSWTQACSNKSLWTKKLKEQKFQTTVVSSEICLDVSDRDQCFLLQTDSDDHKQSLKLWKHLKPEPKDDQVSSLNRFTSVFRRRNKPAEIILRGPGMEGSHRSQHHTSGNFINQLMWSRPDILQTVGADEHAGVVMRYQKGVCIDKFVIKILYSGSRRIRNQQQNIGRVNNIGVFNRDTGVFTFSRQVITKVKRRPKFLYILNQNEGLADIEETIGELKGYVTNGREQDDDDITENTDHSKKSTKLAILLMSDTNLDKLYSVVDVVEELKLRWLEDQARILDNADLEWRVYEGDYDDFDTIDIALQWILK